MAMETGPTEIDDFSGLAGGSSLRGLTDAQISDLAARTARTMPGVTDVSVSVHRTLRTLDSEPATRPTRASSRPGPPAIVTGPEWHEPPDAPATLVEALVRAAAADEPRGTTFVLAGEREDRQSYRDLLDDASCALTGLRAAGLAPGDSVLLQCDDNRNFVTGFWACLLGGMVPTPSAVPTSYRSNNATTRRLHGAWELLGHPPLLTDRALHASASALRDLWQTDSLRVLTVEDLGAARESADPHTAHPDEPVVHLLTSGSTGTPKCVRHSHRTVITRAYANAAANGFSSSDVTLNFMPLDHVAGMVMHNVRDVVLQCEHINARTDQFIADPLRWLDWIDRYRPTNTSAPNFVVTLITKRAKEIACRHWDLSSVKDITNGGEAIVARTNQEFLRLLAPHGLPIDAMRPAWGMSEMCGGVVHSTLRGDDDTAGVVTVDARATGGRLVALPGSRAGHPTFTEVGTPIAGTTLRVVDDDGDVVEEDRIGHLQARGITRMVGYYRNPEAERESFTDDGWFVTGDLAFVHDGRLVITGRAKEVVVVHSANYSCHEIESVVEEVPGVAPTCVAACSEHDPETGTDELVVFCVMTVAEPEARLEVARAAQTQLARQVGVRPRRVVAVRSDEFPKSSAGKIERKRLLADFTAGTLTGARNLLPDADRTKDRVSDGPDLFTTSWTPVPPADGDLPPGFWLVLGPLELAAGLRAGRGAGPVVGIMLWPEQRNLGDGDQVDAGDEDGLSQAVAGMRAQYGDPSVLVLAPGPEDAPEKVALLTHRVLRAWAPAARARMIVLTSGSRRIDSGDDRSGGVYGEAAPTPPVIGGGAIRPAHSAVTGLIRTANTEAGRARVRQVDVDPDIPDLTAALLAELRDDGPEEVVAYRSGTRRALRIRPCAPATTADPGRRLVHGGLYLITGGLGRIGSALARFLLDELGARIMLTGRTKPSGERARRLDELRDHGTVCFHVVDAADPAATRAAVLEAERWAGRSLDGAVHAAGADFADYWDDLGSHLLDRERLSELARMYRPKVGGAQALAVALADRPSALLVLLSSVNGHFGGTGFGAYASASGVLAALAEQRHQLGLPTQCQSWSFWSFPGLPTTGHDAARELGYRAIDPTRGVHSFQEALAHPAPHVLVGLDAGYPHIGRELDPSCVARTEVTVTVRGGDRADAADVQNTVSRALGCAPHEVRAEIFPRDSGSPSAGFVPTTDGVTDVQTPDGVLASMLELWDEILEQQGTAATSHFIDLGGTSLSAMRLVDRMNTRFGVGLTIQQLYDNPTPDELAQQVRLFLAGTGRSAPG